MRRAPRPLPHLFPPTTNRFNPTTREPPTIALPAVSGNFAAFQLIGIAAEEAAATLVGAETEAQLRDAARTLRGTCDACHAAFTKPYFPPKVTDEDLNFDFDKFLRSEPPRLTTPWADARARTTGSGARRSECARADPSKDRC